MHVWYFADFKTAAAYCAAWWHELKAFTNVTEAKIVRMVFEIAMD